jgi:hypothetical protein
LKNRIVRLFGGLVLGPWELTIEKVAADKEFAKQVAGRPPKG